MATSTVDKLMIFSLFFPETRLWYFMQIVIKSQCLFSWKNKKNISKCRPLKILPSLLSVNIVKEGNMSNLFPFFFFFCFLSSDRILFLSLISIRYYKSIILYFFFFFLSLSLFFFFYSSKLVLFFSFYVIRNVRYHTKVSSVDFFFFSKLGFLPWEKWNVILKH